MLTDREVADKEAALVVRHMPDVLRDVVVRLEAPEHTTHGTIDAADFQAVVRETIAAYRKIRCLS